MPIYMDRHEMSENITADHVAKMHRENLKAQHRYGCKGMTYWFDDQRHMAFCLFEAPNKKAIKDMHKHAHGRSPNQIIEVDIQAVESFLGPIHHPINTEEDKVHISKDPAFRVIMILETSTYLNRLESNQFSLFAQKFHKSAIKTIKQYKGSIVKHDNNTYLVSFKSATNAILCALKLQANFKYITPKFDARNRRLKMGIHAGLPVTAKGQLFEEVITTAIQMCEVVKDQVVISTVVKTLYESENRNARIDEALIRTLRPQEEQFLKRLMTYCERKWNASTTNVASFCADLGYSKSQLYRKLIKLTGKSPNTFIREFRLQRALGLLHKKFGNISEIASETGFNSPAYFSKCFLAKFGILPSKYAQQHLA